MVIDSGGGVVPGKHSVLRAQTSKSDEILCLGHVHRLTVDSRRHPDHRPASVAKRHCIDCFLHRLEISVSVLWYRENASSHFWFSGSIYVVILSVMCGVLCFGLCSRGNRWVCFPADSNGCFCQFYIFFYKLIIITSKIIIKNQFYHIYKIYP